MNTEDDASIVVEGLSFRYPGTQDYVLNGASVEIEAGEFVAVIGGNGSGKTTLCKAFNGLIPHFYEGSFEGTVRVGGQNTTEATVSQLSERVGYVFQEFDNQLVSPTVADEVAFGPINQGYDDYRERVERALSLVGLVGSEDRFLWELSGGQKHLVALAAVLSLDPSILVVDEPAAQLDPVHARDTYDHLAALNREHAKTIVTIEHQTEFIAEYCSSVILVDAGEVAWKAPVETALNRLEDLQMNDIHPPQVTRVAETVYEDSDNLPIRLDDGIGQFEFLLNTNGRAIVPNGGFVTDEESYSSESVQQDDAVVSLSAVSLSYPTLRSGSKQVLDQISIDLYCGDRVALVGSNGAGKSTILKLLTGIQKPDSGSVTVNGIDTTTTLPERLAEEVVYVHQNPEEMFVEDSVRADIAHYLKARDRKDTDEQIEKVIDLTDLKELENRDGRLLSVGQQRRASLAIGLATDPSIILLDEPTGSLDLASRTEVGQTIDRAGERVEIVVIATHDLELAAEWANRVIVLDDGCVLKDGTPEEVFTSVEVLKQANLRPPQVVQMSIELDLAPVALTCDDMSQQLCATASQRSLNRGERTQ
jgi:energy-coupling factor transport system ATP-binding protein